MYRTKTELTIWAPLLGCIGLAVIIAYAGASTFLGSTKANVLHNSAPENYLDVYLKDKGIISAYGSDFRGGERINRAEFMKLVLMASRNQHIEGSNCFNDVQEQWFAPFACAAAKQGFISQQDDFHPNALVTLPTAVKVISAAYDLPVRETTPWYQGALEALRKRHAIPDSVRDLEQALTKSEVAEMLYRIEHAGMQIENETASSSH